MKSYTNFKKQLLQDAEIRQAYDMLEPEFALVKQLIEKRIKKGLTQAALAKKLAQSSPQSLVLNQEIIILRLHF